MSQLNLSAQISAVSVCGEPRDPRDKDHRYREQRKQRREDTCSLGLWSPLFYHYRVMESCLPVNSDVFLSVGGNMKDQKMLRYDRGFRKTIHKKMMKESRGGKFSFYSSRFFVWLNDPTDIKKINRRKDKFNFVYEGYIRIWGPQAEGNWSLCASPDGGEGGRSLGLHKREKQSQECGASERFINKCWPCHVVTMGHSEDFEQTGSLLLWTNRTSGAYSL